MKCSHATIYGSAHTNINVVFKNIYPHTPLYEALTLLFTAVRMLLLLFIEVLRLLLPYEARAYYYLRPTPYIVA